MASGVTTIITAIAKIANAGVFFNGLANASNALYFLCLCTSTCWCSKGSQKSGILVIKSKGAVSSTQMVLQCCSTAE